MKKGIIMLQQSSLAHVKATSNIFKPKEKVL